MEIVGLQCHETDNVAVVFSEEAISGATAAIRDKKGNVSHVPLLDEIPFGHKIALRKIDPGDEIIKYGESIGVATKEISIGQHVHIQNMDSQRGRGDWED